MRYNARCRSVAQPGSASALGAEGREFESRRSDQISIRKPPLKFNGGFFHWAASSGVAHQSTPRTVYPRHQKSTKGTYPKQLSGNRGTGWACTITTGNGRAQRRP